MSESQSQLSTPLPADKVKLPRQSTDDSEDIANLSTNTIQDLNFTSASALDKDIATTPVMPPAPTAKSPPVPPPRVGPSPVKATQITQEPVPSAVPVGNFAHAPLPEPYVWRRSSYRVSDKEKQRRKRLLRSNTAIVIGDFTGVYPDELSLRLGEQIEIISKDTVVSRNIGWWTGRNSKGTIGIFPAACVKIASSSIEMTDLYFPQEYPLAIPNHEIEMLEVIGIGGFGKVHRATYRGEDVAVKVAKHTSFNSLKAVQEVISEAEKFAHLAHENVCALIGVVLVRDVCLIMEYARGGALSDVLHKKAISLPIDVILEWSQQIAAGMNYLHHEATPSLIHRDLKSSNILLSTEVDPDNLHPNVIKITDFGLAREIEHTTHMSGAGTYPWMAPEVIRSSDFSKKSDVWSFAVVLWELLTGERPYGGLNLFVVAYGVGQGTLSLPIPDGCPEPLETLMTDCWKRNHSDRPSFMEVVERLGQVEEDDFFSTTSHEVFRSIQSSWKDEIRERFLELKKVEVELRTRENELEKWWQMQDQKLKEKQAALKQQEEDLKEKEKYLEKKLQEVVVSQSDRPPRLKRFSPRRLLRWLSGQEAVKKAQEVRRSSSIPNCPTNAELLTTLVNAHAGTSPTYAKIQGSAYHPHHQRRRSDDYLPIDKENQLYPQSNPLTRRRSSSPSNPPFPGVSAPITVQQVPGSLEKDQRGRASSDVSAARAPSPQSNRRRVYARSELMPSKSAASLCSSRGRGGSLRVTKPGPLTFNNKRASLDNSPNSPMLGMAQYDSGKDSLASSNSSGQQLITLDSPEPALSKAFDDLIEFDPLTISRDSVLSDPYGGRTSITTSPGAISTSSSIFSQPAMSTATQITTTKYSPRNSLATLEPYGSPTIARPRPKPGTLRLPIDSSLPISAPSSRPESPKFPHRRLASTSSSPTGSVHSLIVIGNDYDMDFPVATGFQSDNDSIASSLLDLTFESDLDFPPLTAPLTPECVDNPIIPPLR